jgi:DNA-binding beta-propeller fold protein YncE
MEGAGGAGSRDRGTKRTREEADDTNDGTTNIHVEVTTGVGATVKLQLPPTATVLVVKQEVESELGIRPREAIVFSSNKALTEKLQDEETLDSLVVGEEAKLEQADAQQVVPELSVDPSLVLGDGTGGDDDTQLNHPIGVAFIGAHPDWLVTTEGLGCRIKIINIRTGAVVCKYSGRGKDEGQLEYPSGVAVTSDSSFVIVADYMNHRVQVLRLVVGADGNSAQLNFVRSLGSGLGSAEGQLRQPAGIALLPINGGQGQQETVLVVDADNRRVSQFALDGTFIGIFAGTDSMSVGRGNGEFTSPTEVTVIGSSGEVAVADCNNGVQIFDNEGKFMRKFGGMGKEADGEFYVPAGLASDAHGNLLVVDHTNRLQVLSPEGKHLCTRSDLGLHPLSHASGKRVAWSADGDLAVANGAAHTALVWYAA